MPAAGELVLGLNAVTAINSGTTATPVWEIEDKIKDETLNMETALSDVSTRASKGFRLQVGTLSDAGVDASLLYLAADVPAGSQQDVIRQAFFDKSRLLMGFFDGDPAGSDIGKVSGLVGGFSVTQFSQNRQLEEALMIDVTFTVREDDAGNGPVWTTIDTTPGP